MSSDFEILDDLDDSTAIKGFIPKDKRKKKKYSAKKTKLENVVKYTEEKKNALGLTEKEMDIVKVIIFGGIFIILFDGGLLAYM